jgi:hypothetical protein
MQFTAYGKELEQVLVFKYLGRLFACNDNNTQAMRGNLAKVRKCWAWISRVLRAENAKPRVCRVFYKATVMSVVLFGSETWSLALGTLKRLDCFHHRAAWQMAGMRPLHNGEGNWTYPSNTRALKKVGLCTIEHYIGVRWQTISNYIVNQPIFEHCQNGVRKRSSSPLMFWWDQSMHLDEEAPDGATDLDSNADEE